MADSDGAREIWPNTGPAEEEIRAQLDRILMSAVFDVPERDRRFLSYIVDETLAGRADRLKAYSIATEVFGRGASFDALSDPAVRIEAGRLRRSLERYYLIAGRNDPIIITIPKGGYVPLFTRQAGAVAGGQTQSGFLRPWTPMRARPWWLLAVASGVLLSLGLFGAERTWHAVETAGNAKAPATADNAKAPAVPRLLVLPFEHASNADASAVIARGLTDEVIGQLAKFREIVVISGRAGDTSASDRGQARYALEGSLRTDPDKLRLAVRLLNKGDGSVIWADSYDSSLSARELIRTEVEIANQVATAVAEPYGIIFQSDVASPAADMQPDDWEAYACTLSYYAYRVTVDAKAHADVANCLERTIKRFPAYATAWALLSLTYLDEVRYGYRMGVDPAPPLDRALEAARRAVELDPQNVRGLQARMGALYYDKQVDAALKIGERAIAINPNDSELVGQYGLDLALSGDWKRGGEIIQSVLDRYPGPFGPYETALALCIYMQRDYASAADLIRRANVAANPLYHLVAAAIYGQHGDIEAAYAERDWLTKNAPKLLGNIDREMAIRNVRPEDQAHFVEGLRKAGIPVVGF